MSSRETSDQIAVTLGLVIGVVFVCAGAELTAAAVAGGLVAVVADIPFGSITHASHQGTVAQHHATFRRSRKTHHVKPTGYHYGAFGRM